MKILMFCPRYAAMCLALVACIALGLNHATAQEANVQAEANAVNYDVEVNFIASTNEAGGKLPSRLDTVARQLRASLTPTNYRLAATFLYRVRDRGSLTSRGVINPLFQLPQNAQNAATYSSYELAMERIEAAIPASETINVNELRIGLSVPVVSGVTSQGQSVITYERTNVTTCLALRVDTPTVVGTIPTSRADELVVLVVTLRRAAR